MSSFTLAGNKQAPDTLVSLASGNVQLEVHTVGTCDHHSSTYAINAQVPVQAAFSCVDTVLLSNANVQFTNNSTNAIDNYWDFG